MSVIQSCQDTKDILDFFKPQGLYLKPISRLNISVQLPQLKKSGAKISNWEVMERVKEMGKPFTFSVFKVAKSSLEFIRFEAEIDNFGSMDQVLSKLDMKTIKLSGFQELLKVRAAEAKTPFPTRHDWDSFFRDNKTMNEMKAGERPDTLYIQNLPTKWFLNPHDKSGVSRDKPSEYVLKKVFSAFGDIRTVDIPSLDPYRDKMKKSISGIQTFSFGQDLVFDAFIQYKEYIGFVKAMNSLKGMKLLYKDRYEERSWVANIKVDFDRTKHLAESTIKKRAQEREKLIEKEREREEAERRKRELEEMKKNSEMRRLEEEEQKKEAKMRQEQQVKIQRRMEREERRRRMKMKNYTKTINEDEMIAEEERKLLIAQRKLESIRLLDELLDRVKTVQSSNVGVKSWEDDLFRTAREAKEKVVVDKNSTRTTISSSSVSSYKDQDEKLLRDKLVSRLKQKEEDKMEEQRVKLLKRVEDIDGLSDISDDYQNEELEGEEERTQTKKVKRDSSKQEEDNEDDEEDLRLTSSTEEDEEKKKKKKEKKKKKDKKKKKKEDERRKRRELDSHISLAQRIADRERRSRSRERSRKQRETSRRPTEGYPDYRAIERIREREKLKLSRRKQIRDEEKAKEELYDKMMNPHLYGIQHFPTVPVTGLRKLRRGEHYEEVQKEYLEREIRIRERREYMKKKERERRSEDLQRKRRRRDDVDHRFGVTREYYGEERTEFYRRRNTNYIPRTRH